MTIRLHKKFEKKYKKLRLSEKSKFMERRNIFLDNPFDPILNNHALTGKYIGYRSINITGDLRVIFKILDNNNVLFFSIGTHSNLY